MESLIPSKSKKSLLTTPVKKQASTAVGPTVITPDRVNNPSTRIRNNNFALSVSDVRRTALQLRKSNPSCSGFGSGSSRAPEKVRRVENSAEKIKGSNQLPALLAPKYEMLCEFFSAMVSSIRLLRLKRLPTTLTKLSRNVGSLTDRRFTLHHLAQLKHVVPEIIAVKKIRVQDDESGCMKEDLLVSLEVDAVETDSIAKGSGGYSNLKGVFHSRIIDYATTHPESEDVPEGELPELFYTPKQEPGPSINETSVLRPATLTAPSFKRRFSSRSLGAPVSESTVANQLPETPIKEASSTTVDSDVTPAKFNKTLSKFDTTPAKFTPTPARLMAKTPALRTPKRSLMIEDDAASLPNKSAKRRSLKFEENSEDVEKQEPCLDSISAASQDLLDVLPQNLLHSLMEKERRTLEEQDPIASQARKRQQLMTGVPKLFDMIRLLFQSIRRSVMSKQELMHKLITGHLDIIDREEVDEQFKLLQEIAPEFITEQSCLSGDTLIRLNKFSCAESIRAKLLEAKRDPKAYQTDWQR